MLLAPTKIFPSAGHHLKDTGAQAHGRIERDETIKARNQLMQELKAVKADVSLGDYDWETNLQYQSRIKPGAGSVVFDLHFDAAVPSASGTAVFVKNGADDNTKAAAGEIAATAARVMGIPNRGVRQETQSQHNRIGILHMPGIALLWEVCFITNKGDMAAYDKNKNALLKEVARVLKKWDDKF